MAKTFTLKMDCDNAAFESGACFQIAHILREIADRIEASDERSISQFRTIHDINGNDVGRYALKQI